MILAVFGLLVSFSTVLIAFSDPRRRRIDIFVAVLATHLVATMVNWWLVSDQGFDARFYYEDPLGWSRQSFQTGSVFVIQFTQAAKAVFGGSFFSFFLFFQCFGMIGVAILMRIIDEIAESLGLDPPIELLAVALLPGLHIWTVSIGKDGLLFMAVCLSLWAVMEIGSRWAALLIAVAIMALIRPHIAALSILAVTASLVFDRRLPGAAKLGLAATAILGGGFVLVAAQRQLGLAGLDTASVADYIEQSQTIAAGVAGGQDVIGLPYPLRILSLLYRPFFLDANSLLGLVASLENLFLLAVTGFLLHHARTLLQLSKDVFVAAYSMVFAVAVVLLLALVNYNVGLGLRQKMMAVPAILVLAGCIMLYHRRLGQSGPAMSEPVST